jgi:hypothetical protein
MRAATQHEPKLVNGERMARQHPDTFAIPGQVARISLLPGQCAKVCMGGERFWVKVTLSDARGRYAGQVNNVLLGLGHHGLDYGDVITFEAKHVLDICTPSRDKAEAWT